MVVYGCATGKNQGVTKVTMIYPLGCTTSHFHLVVFEILKSGLKRWSDNLTIIPFP